MSWPWIIRGLTPEEVEIRRVILNRYGYISAFVSFLAFASIIFYNAIRSQHWQQSKNSSAWLQPLSKKLVQADWTLGRNVSRRFSTLGSIRLWMGLVAGSCWLTWICITHTQDDYMHLTKRFAHVASSLFPALYLLSSKNTLQQLSSLTGQTYETLNIVHRWLGRFIIALLSLHATFYINFFIAVGRLDRFGYRDVILGLTLITMMLTIGITSLPVVRQKNYKLFYLLHVVLSVVVLPVAWFHVIYLRYYVALATIVVLYDKLSRLYQSSWTIGEITKLDERSTEVVVDHYKKTPPPGLHMVLTVPSVTIWRYNPFSIESVTASRKMRFVVQKRDGFTRLVAEQASVSKKISMILDGPFGAASSFPPLDTFGQVLFISGGVGATFNLPLCLHMQNMSNTETKPKIKFVWSVRDIRDMQWAMDELSTVSKAQIQIHVSGSPKTNSSTHRSIVSDISDDKANNDDGQFDNSGNIELTENEASQQKLLSDNDNEKPADKKQVLTTDELKKRLPSASVTLGRPNLTDLLSEKTMFDVKGNVAVLVCGPVGLNKSVRCILEKYKEPERIWFWSESFGW